MKLEGLNVEVVVALDIFTQPSENVFALRCGENNRAGSFFDIRYSVFGVQLEPGCVDGFASTGQTGADFKKKFGYSRNGLPS